MEGGERGGRRKRGEERRGEERGGGRKGEERRRQERRGERRQEEAEGREEEEAVMAGINCFRSSLQITLAPRVASFLRCGSMNTIITTYYYMYVFFDLKDSITLSSLQRPA